MLKSKEQQLADAYEKLFADAATAVDFWIQSSNSIDIDICMDKLGAAVEKVRKLKAHANSHT